MIPPRGVLFELFIDAIKNRKLEYLSKYDKITIYGFEKIPKRKNNDDIPESVMSFALDVYDAYGQYTGDQLEYINHKEDPWINARKGLNPWEACSNVISENDMKEYYRARVSNET